MITKLSHRIERAMLEFERRQCYLSFAYRLRKQMIVSNLIYTVPYAERVNRHSSYFGSEKIALYV